jgi:hypothetical protein
VLSAAGIHGACGWLATRLRPGSRQDEASPAVEAAHARLTLAIGVAVILGLSTWGGFTRWPRLFRAPDASGEAAPLARAGAPFERFGRDYWGVRPDLGRAVAEEIRGRALIFIDTQVARHPSARMRRAARHLQFGSAFAHQEPLLAEARVVYLHATPPDWHPRTDDPRAEILEIMREAAEQFPGRATYLYRRAFEKPQPVELQRSRPAVPGS